MSQELLVTPTGINAIKIGFREPVATKAELAAVTKMQGPQGAKGPQGLMGSRGPQGNQGPAGVGTVDDDLVLMLMGG